MKKLMVLMALTVTMGLVAGDQQSALVYYMQPGANYDKIVQAFSDFVTKQIFLKTGDKSVVIRIGDRSAAIKQRHPDKTGRDLLGCERTFAQGDLVTWVEENKEALQNRGISSIKIINVERADLPLKSSPLTKLRNLFTLKKPS